MKKLIIVTLLLFTTYSAFSQWKMDNFVDEFKFKTRDLYIYYSTTGNTDNSVFKGQDINVQMLVGYSIDSTNSKKDRYYLRFEITYFKSGAREEFLFNNGELNIRTIDGVKYGPFITNKKLYVFDESAIDVLLEQNSRILITNKGRTSFYFDAIKINNNLFHQLKSKMEYNYKDVIEERQRQESMRIAEETRIRIELARQDSIRQVQENNKRTELARQDSIQLIEDNIRRIEQAKQDSIQNIIDTKNKITNSVHNVAIGVGGILSNNTALMMVEANISYFHVDYGFQLHSLKKNNNDALYTKTSTVPNVSIYNHLNDRDRAQQLNVGVNIRVYKRFVLTPKIGYFSITQYYVTNPEGVASYHNRDFKKYTTSKFNYSIDAKVYSKSGVYFKFGIGKSQYTAGIGFNLSEKY